MSVRICLALSALLALAATDRAEETMRGTLRRPLTVTCTGGCGDIYLEPDSLAGNIYVANPAGSNYLTGAYVGLHVEVTGFRSLCDGCTPLFVTHPITVISSGVADPGATEPPSFSLHRNFPNPFNPATRIEYDIPAEGEVMVTIRDALGRGVGTIAQEKESAGRHAIAWAAGGLPSGVYYITVTYRAGRGAAAFRTMPVLLIR